MDAFTTSISDHGFPFFPMAYENQGGPHLLIREPSFLLIFIGFSKSITA